jgi:hypothetical protein
MNTRQGLGKGLGSGYRNIAPMDAHIHGLSAKGIKTLQRELKQFKTKLRYFERKVATFERKNEQLYEQEEKATEELKKKMEKVSAPYRKKRNLFENKKNRAENKEWETQKKVKEIEAELEFTQATQGKSMTVEGATAYIKMMNMPYADPHNHVTEKNPLPNGIKIFKGQEYVGESNAGKQIWMAFYKGKLIGYSLRRASEHRADDTSGISFIGKVRLEKKSPDKWGHGVYTNNRVGYKDWVAELSKLDPQKISAVNLKNKGKEIEQLYD